MATKPRRRRSGSKKSGGIGGLFSFFIWAVVIGSMLIAFFNIPSNATYKDFPGLVKAKSDSLQSWFNNCFPKVISGEDTTGCLPSAPDSPDNPGTGGDNPGTAEPGEIQGILASLKQEEATGAKYDRDEWEHWINAPGMSKCLNIRHFVLYEEAAKDDTLVLVDKKGNQVDDIKQACAVKAGTWVDPYTGETITNPKDLDIDHMIPLNYAAQHGGQAWSKGKKKDYANDISVDYHLIAVTASANRSKSDRGPSEWKPSDESNWCQYATDWIMISHNYKLTVAPADAVALTEMLGTCTA